MRQVAEGRDSAGSGADTGRPATPGEPTMSDTKTTIDAVESKLDRAKGRDREEALELLRSAKSDLETLDADDEKVESMATHVNQRIKEVERRDEYSSDDMGAAMNPDDDAAP